MGIFSPLRTWVDHAEVNKSLVGCIFGKWYFSPGEVHQLGFFFFGTGWVGENMVGHGYRWTRYSVNKVYNTTPPKTNGLDTQNDGLEMVTPFNY